MNSKLMLLLLPLLLLGAGATALVGHSWCRDVLCALSCRALGLTVNGCRRSRVVWPDPGGFQKVRSIRISTPAHGPARAAGLLK